MPHLVLTELPGRRRPAVGVVPDRLLVQRGAAEDGEVRLFFLLLADAGGKSPARPASRTSDGMTHPGRSSPGILSPPSRDPAWPSGKLVRFAWKNATPRGTGIRTHPI